jgi:prepilin-type N-terminal cleavage/methylation domain-containing protein
MKTPHVTRPTGRAAGIRGAFSLAEVLAVTAILAILAACIVPRAVGHFTEAKQHACHANQGEIELQAQLWRRNKGTFPAANLSSIGSDTAYFPEGLPVCPVDGTSYTIDTTTGTVIGHTH